MNYKQNTPFAKANGVFLLYYFINLSTV